MLRKAPLPSSADPWSTKRPCGPLAFRRATEGSRVQRKVRGVKRGQETMFGVLSPFALRRGHGVSAAEGGNAHALRGRILASSGEPLYRRKVCRHPTVKRKGRSSPAAAGRRIGGTACRQQTVKRKKTSAEGIRKRLPFVKRAFFSCFTSAYAADFRNYSSTFT